MMLKKETELLFAVTPPADRDETVTYESRKRRADNSLQFDRIMKSSKPSLAAAPSNKLLNAPPTLRKFILTRSPSTLGLETTVPNRTFQHSPYSTVLI